MPRIVETPAAPKPAAQPAPEKPAAQPARRPCILNGVDVTALRATVEAVQANPAVGRFEFRALNRWMGGDRNRTTIGSFTGAMAEHRERARPFIADNGEPDVLMGSDKAPNPAEWMLHALIGCMTTSLVYHAGLRGVEVRSVSSAIDGDIDLRGFLGLSDKVRKGYSAIRVHMRIDADATVEALTEMIAMSPMFDVVSRSAPVEVVIETA
jgi:uncharacterized OsmC-like protein